jgi:hypothetical protein
MQLVAATRREGVEMKMTQTVKKHRFSTWLA